MQSEQQIELRHLTEAAAEILAAVAESGSYCQVFSFWKLPSFGDQFRYTLYTPRRSASNLHPLLTTTTWQRNVDSEKLRDPVERLKHPRQLLPTILELSMVLGFEAVTDSIRVLEGIGIPSLRPSEQVIGLDGTQFRFAFSQGYYSLDVSWWADRPQSWQGFAGRIYELVSNLQNNGNQEAEQDETQQPPLAALSSTSPLI